MSTYDAAIGAGEKGQKYALHMSKKRQLLGLLQDVINFNASISPKVGAERNYLQRGHQQALPLLEVLQVRGLLANVIIYNAGISAHEKGQRPQRALHL